jgi:hypothetical protein
VAVACTIILDMLITALAERTGTHAWPVNPMRLLAWLWPVAGAAL